jgi:very-short-patch-repair endonuclease
MHRLPVWGANLARAHLLRPVKREVLTERFVIRPSWPLLRELDIAESCAPLPLALVQHALEHGAAPGVVATDAALHRGLVSMHALEWAGREVRGWPRSSRVRSMLAHVDGRSESVGESRLRFGLAVAGIAVVPQVVIEDRNGRFVARVDFLVEGTNIVIEFDGKVKYRDGGADALMAEKRREDTLRRLGYVVIRVTWADLEDMPMVVGWIRREMAASRDKVVLRPTSQAG